MEFVLNYWVEFLFTTITTLLIYMFKQYVGLKSGIKALLNNEIIKIYELNTYNQIEQNIYEYKNSLWKDQLTKFNNVEITYELEGNKIIFEKSNEYVIYYIRSVDGRLIGFKYNNDTYYYIKNIQEDIIGILDSNYNIVAKYQYDSYGNNISITDSSGNLIVDNNNIANINPFRYRSYYYDRETNLYYLNSRYYNPVWGRFVNADGIIDSNRDIISCNLYVYCSNNPISCRDENGEGFFSAILTSAVVGALANVAGRFVRDMINSAMSKKLKFSSPKEYAVSAVTGAISGIGYAVGKPVLTNYIANTVSSASKKNYKKVDSAKKG